MSTIESNTSNPCLDSCRGSCCKNMTFDNLTLEQLKLLTPDGTRVINYGRKNDVPSLDDRFLANGVYYGESYKSVHFAVVKGACPNLDTKGECTIYEKRPLACRLYESGTKQCNKARAKDNLPKISELIQVQPKANK